VEPEDWDQIDERRRARRRRRREEGETSTTTTPISVEDQVDQVTSQLPSMERREELYLPRQGSSLRYSSLLPICRETYRCSNLFEPKINFNYFIFTFF
jgi:hypothetical protein